MDEIAPGAFQAAKRRIKLLEELVCYKESKVDLPPEHAALEKELFRKYPFGALPQDKN